MVRWLSWCPASLKRPVNLDETVAVTRAITRAVLPGFNTLGTMCECIKRKQASNQQVGMMSAKLLWPWEVLDFGLPTACKVRSSYDRYNQRTSIEYPLL